MHPTAHALTQSWTMTENPRPSDPVAADQAADAAAAGSGGAAETVPSFSPLYRQIKQRLVHSLQAGEWLPGQSIPSENELAQRYRVSWARCARP